MSYGTLSSYEGKNKDLYLPRSIKRHMNNYGGGSLPEAQFLPLDLLHSFHSTYQKAYIEKDIRAISRYTRSASIYPFHYSLSCSFYSTGDQLSSTR